MGIGKAYKVHHIQRKMHSDRRLNTLCYVILESIHTTIIAIDSEPKGINTHSVEVI